MCVSLLCQRFKIKFSNLAGKKLVADGKKETKQTYSNLTKVHGSIDDLSRCIIEEDFGGTNVSEYFLQESKNPGTSKASLAADALSYTRTTRKQHVYAVHIGK